MTGFHPLRCARQHPWVIPATVAVLAFVGWAIWSSIGIVHSTNDRLHQQLERRIANSGQLYGNCVDLNDLRHSLDVGYQQALFPAERPPTNAALLSRFLDQLRAPLAPTDCERVLEVLLPEYRNDARRVAQTLPHLPLPPPTVPGYVP